MAEQKTLPTYKGLYLSVQDMNADLEEAYKNDQLAALLNNPPHSSWIKKHPMAKKKVNGQMVAADYIPIQKIELLLTQIFQNWRVEVLREGVMFNSVFCTIRLHYKNPLNGVWSYHDGVGSKSVQVDSGKSASDLAAIKDAAVMMALPSAKSYAIKDAAQHLGALFGRDLNRNDTDQFRPTYSKPEEDNGFTPDPPSRDNVPETQINDIQL